LITPTRTGAGPKDRLPIPVVVLWAAGPPVI
jgi:hypothetical protein